MSTTFTPAIVQKVAKLARISTNLSPEEEIKYSKQLDSVMTHLKDLEEVDVNGVNVFAGSRTMTVSQLRADEPPSDDAEYARVRNNIIANFPQRQGDLLALPGIFG